MAQIIQRVQADDDGVEFLTVLRSMGPADMAMFMFARGSLKGAPSKCSIRAYTRIHLCRDIVEGVGGGPTEVPGPDAA